MVNRIISELLGPFVVILQYTRTRTGLITIFFGSYLLMYALGLYQLRAIRKRTELLIEEKYRSWMKTDQGISKKKLFERFMKVWEEDLKNTRSVFILNKHDLWPVKITPANVLVKIPLSPQYIEEYLSETAAQRDQVQNGKIGLDEDHSNKE